MLLRLAVLAIALSQSLLSVSAATSLIDASGKLKLAIPSISTSDGVVVLISSPGTPSYFGNDSTGAFLSIDDTKSSQQPVLSCKGATLSAASTAERTSLTLSSLVADAVIVDGIAEGDIEMGLQNSRHSRTLTALFRAKLQKEGATRQTLILSVLGDADKGSILDEVKEMYDAIAEEVSGPVPSLSDLYSVEVVTVKSSADAKGVLSSASNAAKSSASGSGDLSESLKAAQKIISESGVVGVGLDPPHVAQAFLTCKDTYASQSKTVRAKVAAWRSRCARGLLVDNFGKEAADLYDQCLEAYDSTTLFCAGIPLVAGFRLESRKRLQALLETSIRELYQQQVRNLQDKTLNNLNNKFVQVTKTQSAKSDLEAYTAALRAAAFAFDTKIGSIEVPSLGLSKQKAVQETDRKLQDALRKFPDSPRAKLLRTSVVKKTTARQRKPKERAIDFGLDFVGMVRPDGFGSLQGFVGYQLGGNSITVGVHNDADDPQVISQFGGVRPPLFRFQPKLRVDVEL